LDDKRRLAIVDVHDHGQRQGGLEGVLRDQCDLGQVLVVLVGARLRLVPFQNEIGRRHQENLARVGVERVLAGQERLAPDSAQSLLHQLAVLVIGARQILTHLSGVGDDDADVAHLDHRLGHRLDRREEPIDVVRAFHQHLELSAPLPARAQEALGVLEAVVIGVGLARVVADRGRDDLPGRQ